MLKAVVNSHHNYQYRNCIVLIVKVRCSVNCFVIWNYLFFVNSGQVFVVSGKVLYSVNKLLVCFLCSIGCKLESHSLCILRFILQAAWSDKQHRWSYVRYRRMYIIMLCAQLPVLHVPACCWLTLLTVQLCWHLSGSPRQLTYFASFLMLCYWLILCDAISIVMCAGLCV